MQAYGPEQIANRSKAHARAIVFLDQVADLLAVERAKSAAPDA
jgi:hypothetical protein